MYRSDQEWANDQHPQEDWLQDQWGQRKRRSGDWEGGSENKTAEKWHQESQWEMKQAQRQLPGEEEETEQIRNQQWQQSWAENEWEQPVPKQWVSYQEETSQQAETQKVEVQKGGETQRNPIRMQQIAWLFEQTMENQHQIIRDR